MSYSLRLKIRKENGLDKNGECPIHLQYIHARERIFLTTQQKINPTYWDSDVDRPKRSYPAYKELIRTLNAKLEQIELIIEQYQDDHGKYPSISTLKSLVYRPKVSLGEEQKEKNKLASLWEQYITDQASKQIKRQTLQIYSQTWDKWVEFSIKRGEEYTYQDIKFELLEKFRAYLLGKNYQKNTRGKAIKTMKAFFNYLAITKELPLNPSYKRVSAEKEEVETVTLSQEELEIIKREVLYSNYPGFGVSKYDLTDNQKIIGRIMVFLCSTGLSYVDYDSLRIKHLIVERKDESPINARIELVRTKVDTAKCIIPVLDTTIDLILVGLGEIGAEDIYQLKALDYVDKVKALNNFIVRGFKSGSVCMESRIFPRVYSAIFNREIKSVLKSICIDAMVSKIIFRGKEKIERLVPKHELISSHTGRRTYVTLSFEHGNDAVIIMKTTGHSKIETMNRYNRVSAQQIQEKIKKHTPTFND